MEVIALEPRGAPELRLYFQWGLGLGALVLCLACASPPSDVVRVGVDVDAGTLDPRLARDTTAYRAVNLIYDGLIQLDASLLPEPSLATHWEARDETHWVFHLREGVRFHDGTVLSADDVVYTFRTLLDPALRAPLRALYTPIAAIRALDSSTVELSLSEPYAPLFSYLEMGIVSKRYVESGKDTGRLPMGSGPFRLASWEPGSKIRLAGHSDHWSGVPTVQQVELVVIADNTARAQAFEAFDLELIQSPLSPRDAARLASGSEQRRENEGLAINYLNFNTARAPLKDARMRRALSMLVDQTTILETIYEDMDRPAQSVLLPSWQAFTTEVRQPTYDAKRALALLEELGWVDSDGDGIRDRQGTPLTIELGTHGEDVNRVQTVEYLQNVWLSHGIQTQIRISDWPSFSVRRDAGDYDVILLGWTHLVDPDRLLFDQLHSRGGLNWGRYQNAELDALLVAARRSRSPQQRAEQYRRAATIIATELPYFVLSQQNHQTFFSRRLEDFEPEPRGMLRGLTTARLVAR